MEKLLHVNGIEMGVVQRGEDEPRVLVLLHGFAGCASGWGDLLDELALPGMRIIAFDILGHGQSSVPAASQRYDMEHCQADIIAALRQLGIGQGEAILLGYSMGGRIALYSAFSGFFHALILESASPGLANPAEREQRCANDMALADSIERDGIPAFVERWEQHLLFASQRMLPAEKRAALHAQRLRNSATGLANSLRGVGTGTQPALHARLPTLSLPVLLIAGALDTKFCEIARQMAQQLPNARLQVVPEAGHTVHLEQPEAFSTLVRKFCIAIL